MLIRDIVDDDWSAGPQIRELWGAPAPGATVVAVDGDRVLGSAKMGPNRLGRGAHVATASVMVAPAAGRRGVGRALGGHVVDWARGAGFRGTQFNAVVETNTAAVRLWHSLGFVAVPGAVETTHSMALSGCT